ncbi:MAG: formylglycine-generating enzyme family protein [Myxococcales bacterium]|nr:formylglycine-generating enzyme family protein [Myxococcales bacterium]
MPAFELSRSEVTVGQYLACVEAGACPPPVGGDPCTAARPRNAWNLQLPLNCVSRAKMLAFAEWVGGRLPTEAEWEFAARSAAPQPWPWGDAPAECGTHGIMCGADAPRQVCQAPEGFSAQGVCDLVGNLSELVADRYLADLTRAPVDGSAYTGPAEVGVAGAEHWHAYRGGNFFSGLEYQRVTLRGPTDPDDESRAMGFRVAR